MIRRGDTANQRWLPDERPFGSPPATGVFHVVDGAIRDPHDRPFFPFGANTGLHYTTFPYPFRFTDVPQTGAINSLEGDESNWPSQVAAAQAWGWNFLRTNVIAFNDDPSFLPPSPTATDHANLIAHGVDELLAAGFVVLMDGRTNQPGDNQSTLNSDNDLNAREFVSRCLEMWGDNPLFWVNPFNEPFSDDDSTTVATMVTLYTSWISWLRGEGYEGPIVFDLPRYAQGINRAADGSFDSLMALDDNLILGWHHYGFPTAFADETGETGESMAAATKARGHCVLLGELGFQWDGNSPIPVEGAYEANRAAAEWALVEGRAEHYDMGIAIWHAGHDEFNVTSDRQPFFNSANDGTGLNSYGDMIWDLGQALDSPAPYTPPGA